MSEEQKKQSKGDNVKSALCYVPFVSFFIFFTEENKDDDLKKHIKYGSILLIGYILLRFIIVGILNLPLGFILFVVYGCITGYFGFKAYNGEDFEIEQIDKIEEEINKKL